MSDNKKHMHADLMLEYALDASRTDEPWLLWEQLCPDEEWRTFRSNPDWNINSLYRRKPEMITIGKVSFPKPIDYELKEGQKYYVTGWSGSVNWKCDEMDIELLENGRIHLTKEAAEKHHDALIKISRGEF
ncbi:hypothetical protein [Photorhabdus tasmaniensis]|uniref:Uncharacterized protein n=1 Tax=Photorhabdus tasmaniensis TaxID=1004159 RepID=A0ABX0GN83_9GAMM|nr:hypothetical protein [Photorhabdus tasmaniensis]NHB90344.1 hypothetical protein [Photorhabdus tasmaniensis]